MAKNKKNKKPLELIIVADRSRSMSGLTSDSVGNINSYVQGVKSEGVDAKVTLISFDSSSQIVCDRVPINKWKDITGADIPARGRTALHDAVGFALTRPGAKRKRPTMVMIDTDGLDNMSKEHSSNTVKSLIKEKTKLGWDFQFTGVGLDAFDQGDKYGLAANQILNVLADAGGLKSMRHFRSSSTRSYAASTGHIKS